MCDFWIFHGWAFAFSEMCVIMSGFCFNGQYVLCVYSVISDVMDGTVQTCWDQTKLYTKKDISNTALCFVLQIYSSCSACADLTVDYIMFTVGDNSPQLSKHVAKANLPPISACNCLPASVWEQLRTTPTLITKTDSPNLCRHVRTSPNVCG